MKRTQESYARIRAALAISPPCSCVNAAAPLTVFPAARRPPPTRPIRPDIITKVVPITFIQNAAESARLSALSSTVSLVMSVMRVPININNPPRTKSIIPKMAIIITFLEKNTKRKAREKMKRGLDSLMFYRFIGLLIKMNVLKKMCWMYGGYVFLSIPGNVYDAKALIERNKTSKVYDQECEAYAPHKLLTYTMYSLISFVPHIGTFSPEDLDDPLEAEYYDIFLKLQKRTVLEHKNK